MTERKKLESQLDTLTSLIVRKRDRKCIDCGVQVNLTCSHLFHRSKRAVRWDLKNCNCHCLEHNERHDQHPEFYIKWFIDEYGQREYDILLFKSNQIKRFTIEELRELKTSHESYLSELNQG